MLQAVIYSIVTVILTKELATATDNCTEHQFQLSYHSSCEDIYYKNVKSRTLPGYYTTEQKVYCGMSYSGSSCENIFRKYPEIHRTNPKEKSGYYRLNNNQWTYCDMAKIAANAADFISTCSVVEIGEDRMKSYNQTFLPDKSCESIYNNNQESHNSPGFYWITSRVYCGMNYTGSSCEDIYNSFPNIQKKSGYYRININQWKYCDMIAIATGGKVISTCAGVEGEWRRIVNVNISAGDDCPGEWRKATQSGVTFCRVASDDLFTCSSANFSTNGISYQRVCGRARGYQKGITVAFQAAISFGRTVDKDYVDGLSITHGNRSRQHIWTFASGYKEDTTTSSTLFCPCVTNSGITAPPFVNSHYYCESGTATTPSSSVVYTADPLWDGEDCDTEGTCCDDATKPWFFRQLYQATQDDIEARICTHGPFSTRSPLVDQLELYIQ